MTTRKPSRRATDPAADQPRDLASLTHELEVHQIELESQNEELRRAQSELAAARDRFIDLYDFAPVGYLTLDADGHITEINFAGAALLGDERRRLQGRRLATFVARHDRERWQHHLQLVLQQRGPARIDLELSCRGGTPRQTQLDSLVAAAAGGAPLLRLTLTDISDRHSAEMDRRISSGLFESRETERHRVARELHEELGQRLSALKIELSALRHGGPAAPPQLAGMLDSLDEAVSTVRRIVGELRPLMLDDLGLPAALDWLARDAGRRLGLDVVLALEDPGTPLGEPTSIGLYRLAEATLSHIADRCRSRRIVIALWRQANDLLLTLQDEGEGWPIAAPRADDSHRPLRDQAHLLGARLAIDELPGGSRRFSFHLPLPRAGAPARRAARSP